MRCCRTWAALLAATGLAGCSLGDDVVGRYAEAVCVDRTTPGEPVRSRCQDALPDALVSVVLAPVPASQDRGAMAMPEAAQAAFVTAMAQPRFSESSADYRRNLVGPLDGGARSPFRDASSVPGLLTITIANGNTFSPADRIERATIRIVLEEATFTNWTAWKTLYGEVRPGSITSTRESSLSGGVTASLPVPVPVGLSASASATASRQQTIDLALNVEDITPRIESSRQDGLQDTLVVERNGGLGRDLRGNAQVEVTVRRENRTVPVTVFQVEGLSVQRVGGGRPRPVVSSETVRVPEIPLRATVTMDYVTRHVVSGHSTLEDADDRVEYIRNRTATKVIPLAPQAVLWGVYLRANKETDALRIQRHARDRDGVDMCFETEGDADTLAKHLQANPTSVLDGRTIGFFRDGRLVAVTQDPSANWGVTARCGGLLRRTGTPLLAR